MKYQDIKSHFTIHVCVQIIHNMRMYVGQAIKEKNFIIEVVNMPKEISINLLKMPLVITGLAIVAS